MKKTYYLLNPGRLSRNDNTLKFIPINEKGVEGTPKFLPIEAIDQLYVFGSLDANSALYNFLGKNEIAVHFFDYYENYTGSFMPRDGLVSGKMVVEQVKSFTNDQKRLVIAQKFIEGAAFNLLKNLKYYDNRGKDLQAVISSIEQLSDSIPKATDIPSLMGIEGNIRQVYYEAFNLILTNFEMNARTRRPPLDEVNAMISFGNMVCYSQCLRAIHQTQLHPAISYLHTPGDRRYSLALDIAELFKPILVDRTIFRIVNKREINHGDFEPKLGGLYLKESGRKIFLTAFEEKLNETFMHRSLKRNVSYKHLMKLECYKLIKHILNIETYKPFKIYW